MVRIYSVVRVLIKKATLEELSKKNFELSRNVINMGQCFIRAGGKIYYKDSVYMDE